MQLDTGRQHVEPVADAAVRRRARTETDRPSSAAVGSPWAPSTELTAASAVENPVAPAPWRSSEAEHGELAADVAVGFDSGGCDDGEPDASELVDHLSPVRRVTLVRDDLGWERLRLRHGCGVDPAEEVVEVAPDRREAGGVGGDVVHDQADHRCAVVEGRDQRPHERPVNGVEELALEGGHRSVARRTLERVVGCRGHEGRIERQSAVGAVVAAVQGAVAFDDGLQRPVHRCRFEGFLDDDAMSHVVAQPGRVRCGVEQQRGLVGREGVTLDGSDARFGSGRRDDVMVVDVRSEVARGGVEEHELVEDLDAERVADRGGHGERCERVAAEREEVVVDADGFGAEHPLPHRHDRGLEWRLGGDVQRTAGSVDSFGGRQRRDVELAVGGHRQRRRRSRTPPGLRAPAAVRPETPGAAPVRAPVPRSPG